MTLRELEAGKSAVIRRVGGEGALRQHFLDMGMIPGAEVTMVKLAPMGDPMEVQVHGYELTLRLAEAAAMSVWIAPGTPTIPVLARAASTTARRASIRCRRTPS